MQNKRLLKRMKTETQIRYISYAKSLLKKFFHYKNDETA